MSSGWNSHPTLCFPISSQPATLQVDDFFLATEVHSLLGQERGFRQLSYLLHLAKTTGHSLEREEKPSLLLQRLGEGKQNDTYLIKIFHAITDELYCVLSLS